MSILTRISHISLTALTHENFLLSVQQSKEQTRLTLKLLIPEVGTASFPKTHQILHNLLPGIFKHKCYNYLQRPFSEEVKNTPLGHLFEHITLEYLRQLAPTVGIFKSFKGKTSWNWYVDEKGTFQIIINCGYDEKSILSRSLTQAISLFNVLLHQGTDINVRPSARMI